jgi:hypothetical protein
MHSFLINDAKMKDAEKGANVFSSFFLLIVENLYLHQVGKVDRISFSKDSFPCKFHAIKIVPTSEAEIKSMILFLKSENKSGYDEITSKTVKACASLISQPLSHICNHSLYRGVFPYHLKISIVKPLFKKGDKTSMTNYRPISLLTVFSKVPEKVMYNRLSHHRYTNSILVPEQFGFRQGKYRDNAAFKLTNNALKTMHQKVHVGGIFCDLVKAFDSMNHEILLVKLHYYGTQGRVANWFRSYLTKKKNHLRNFPQNGEQ